MFDTTSCHNMNIDLKIKSIFLYRLIYEGEWLVNGESLVHEWLSTVRNCKEFFQTLCLYWYLQYPSAKSNFNDTSKSARIITLILTIAFFFYLRAFWSVRFVWGDIFSWFTLLFLITDHQLNKEWREISIIWIDTINDTDTAYTNGWLTQGTTIDWEKEFLNRKWKNPVWLSAIHQIIQILNFTPIHCSMEWVLPLLEWAECPYAAGDSAPAVSVELPSPGRWYWCWCTVGVHL